MPLWTVPANRLVVKMQTNVGTVNMGTMITQSGSLGDPLYGVQNKTTPVRWKVQYLNRNTIINIMIIIYLDRSILL